MCLADAGLLNFGDPDYGANGPEGTLLGPVPNLNRLGLPFRKLSAQGIEKEYGFTNLPKNYLGINSKQDCGCINVPLLTRTLYKLGKDLGVTYHEYAEVTGMMYKDMDGVEVVYQQYNAGERIQPVY